LGTIPVYNFKDPTYGAKGAFVKTSISGSVASGATSIPVLSTSGFAKFDYVAIPGAGASGGIYRGQITGDVTSGQPLTISPGIATGVSGASVYVDDTTPIQNAISAAIDGSIVYFPEGTYALSNQLLVSGKPLRLMGDGVGTRLEAITAFPASTAILKLDANGPGGYARPASNENSRASNTGSAA